MLAIENRAGTETAVKMAGLPAFLMGLSMLIFAGLQGLGLIETRLSGVWTVAVCLFGGLLLIWLGLGLRKGRAPFAPVAFGVTAVAFVGLAITQPIGTLILPGVLLIMAANGLRGWLWLRQRGKVEDIF